MTMPRVESAAGGAADGLWAITCFFNPMGYRRRRMNYRVFRERLGVPLLAVELGFQPAFELEADDAEILVQIRGGDVLWQKERLLNVALDALPDDCEKVAWIDGDVLFENRHWPEQAGRLLDRLPLVQLFSEASNVRREAPIEQHIDGHNVLPPRDSLARGIASGASADECLWDASGVALRYRAGLAWAARREWIDRVRYYDACVIGGADLAMACAYCGQHDIAIKRLRMNRPQSERYRTWAETAFDAVRGDIGCVEGRVLHLWHGENQYRRLEERHLELEPFAFDPHRDVAIGEGGSWRWSSDKPELHRFLRAYFAGRREDGDVSVASASLPTGIARG